MRTVSFAAVVALASLAIAAPSAEAAEFYYAMVFGSQSHPKLLRYTHTWATFVRAVMDQVGRDGFNAVWTSPETLPHAAEILDPEAWVRRVHGGRG